MPLVRDKTVLGQFGEFSLLVPDRELATERPSEFR